MSIMKNSLTRLNEFARVHDEKKRHPASLLKATNLAQSMQLNDRNDLIKLSLLL